MHLWSKEEKDGKNLILLTPAEFAELPDGTELECINGTKVIKGRDYIDDDTRAGVLAYGLR